MLAGSETVLYVLPGCDRCNAARTWLNQHNIPFTEVNVLKHPRKARHISLGCVPPFPVMERQGEVFSGVDAALLQSLFKQA